MRQDVVCDAYESVVVKVLDLPRLERGELENSKEAVRTISRRFRWMARTASAHGLLRASRLRKLGERVAQPTFP